MEKISGFIDKPVFGEKERKQIGVVSDILFDEKTLIPSAYVVSCGSVLRTSHILDIKDIRKSAPEGLWTAAKSALKPIRSAGFAAGSKSFRKDAKGAKIVSGGKTLGRVSDMLFNTETGEIMQIEVSSGFAEDILHGRKSILTHNTLVFGNNNLEIKGKGESQ